MDYYYKSNKDNGKTSVLTFFKFYRPTIMKPPKTPVPSFKGNHLFKSVTSDFKKSTPESTPESTNSESLPEPEPSQRESNSGHPGFKIKFNTRFKKYRFIENWVLKLHHPNPMPPDTDSFDGNEEISDKMPLEGQTPQESKNSFNDEDMSDVIPMETLHRGTYCKCLEVTRDEVKFGISEKKLAHCLKKKLAFIEENTTTTESSNPRVLSTVE